MEAGLGNNLLQVATFLERGEGSGLGRRGELGLRSRFSPRANPGLDRESRVKSQHKLEINRLLFSNYSENSEKI